MASEDEFSSPACLAHEMSGLYMGHASPCEIAAALCDLLAAADARDALAKMIAAQSPDRELKMLALAVRRDGARRRALLVAALRARGHAPTDAPSTTAPPIVDPALRLSQNFERAAAMLRALIPKIPRERPGDVALAADLCAMRAKDDAMIDEIRRLIPPSNDRQDII